MWKCFVLLSDNESMLDPLKILSLTPVLEKLIITFVLQLVSWHTQEF